MALVPGKIGGEAAGVREDLATRRYDLKKQPKQFTGKKGKY